MKIDMDTECWFCRRKTKELLPIVGKFLEADIEEEAELKKKGHPYKELLFSHEDMFDVITLRKDFEFPICVICKEMIRHLIYERESERLEQIIEKLQTM